MQGRLFGLVASSVSIMSPLGLVIAGPLADTVGTQVWFVIGGAVTVAIGAAGFFIPVVYRIEDDHQKVANSGDEVILSTDAASSEKLKDAAEPVSM